KQVALPENVGLGHALAAGLKECRYELVARMDTDDICMETRFQRQIGYMYYHRNLAICGSYITEIDPETEQELAMRRVPSSEAAVERGLPLRNPFNHMTVMFRKSAIMAVGNYQPF